MLKNKPFFSIIIPTYNRPERLKTCLESLSSLNFPKKQFEVVIVDDGSFKPLDDIVHPFKNQLSLNLIRQDNTGPATARNTGASHAKGDFLAFTDDDCQPDSNWLTVFAQGFEQDSNALLGGHTINALSNNLYSETSQFLIDYLYIYYNTDSQQARFFTSNNFALPRKLFEEVGGFDTTFPLAAGEDREFCDRWLYNNYPMKYLPEAIIYHSHHLSFRKFWRQHFNYGYGAFCFHQVRAKRNQQSIKVEPFNFYIKLLLFPSTKLSEQPKLLISSLFLISQFANISGFFWKRFQQTVSSFLPEIFSYLRNDKKHIS